MSKTGRLLDNDEVEFLLHGGREVEGSRPAESAGQKPAHGEAPREVTMRGDLDKINLSDIFQTLGMSQMEGLLHVRGPLESREVHFKDGQVRVLVPRRVETLRLGQRLVRAGVVTADQLRSTLLEQRKTKRTLGAILAEQNLATADDIEEVVHNQLQEDLFALFTWPHGTFEFYKGEVLDPVVLDRLQSAPRFEVNGVLLEVARRSDEWMRVMDAVGSLDEIVVATCAPDEIPEEADDDTRELLEAADGRATIRDLADVTLISLFDCGLMVRDLLADGWLRKLSIGEMLDAVEAIAEAGEPRRAVIVLRAVLDRDEQQDLDTTQRIGALMVRCGEQRRAAGYLLQAARRAEDDADALELGRLARAADRLSADVLSFLTGVMRGAGDADPAELADVLTDLGDALADRGDYEEARAVVDELEELTGDLPLCRPRKARVLAKLGWTEDAVEALLGLVELYKEQGDRERTAATYEQILKIDYRRKDVARALKGLHASKLARRGKLAAAVATVVALGFAGLMQFESWQREEALLAARAQVSDALRGGDIERATAIAHDAAIRFGEADGVRVLREEIQRFEQTRNRAESRHLEEIRVRIEAEARDLFRGGQATAAMGAIEGLRELGIGREGILQTTRAALTPLLVEFTAVADTLPAKVPEPPSLAQSQPVQKAILDELVALLAAPTHAAVAALAEFRNEVALKDALGSKDHAALFSSVERLNQVYARLVELHTDYESRLERRTLALELTPLFHEAREFEKANRFEDALEAYRTLVRNHPENDELRTQFEERVERYSTILRFLGLIEKATHDGDFPTAQGQLRALKRQFPNLPFDALARLPLRIRTTPEGARVLIDGQVAGIAPVLTSYRPAAETRVRVELDGFQPEETVLSGDSVGVVRSLLARLPRWVARRDTTIDRAPTPDASGHLFVTDRAGTISMVRARDGTVLWSRPTHDLSGLLTRVVQAGRDRVLCGSIDGPLRCLRTKDGAELWSLPDLPTESTPVVLGEVVVVATDDARLLGLDPRDGTVLWSNMLPGPVRADLVALDDRHVLAATSLAEAVAVDARHGRVLWTARTGHGVVAVPAVGRGDVVVAAEDGEVTRLEAGSGEVRWRARGFANLTLTPAILQDSVLVGDGPDVFVLDRRTGRRSRTLEMRGDLRMPLAVIGDLVFVGDASGLVTALGTDDLEPRFVLRADGAALAPVVALDDGTLVAAFQDRTMRAYPPVTGR